jgi:hypothetical protein
MKPNFYSIFRNKLYEEEIRTTIDSASTLEKILGKSKKITSVLTRLITSQKDFNEKAKNEIREIVGDVRFISYNPTTFKIILKNGNFFDLKYDPTPLQLKHEREFDPKDMFILSVSGKKYNLSNKSEMEQGIDYINNLLKTSPITKEPSPIEEPGEEKGGEPIPPPPGEGGAEVSPEESPEKPA